MRKQNIVKSVAVQALSGSTSPLYVGDLSFKDASIAVYSASASGSYDVEKSIDGVSWVAIAARQVTGTGAAVAVNLQMSPASGSAQYLRLSNVTAGVFPMGGSLTGSISGPPNP